MMSRYLLLFFLAATAFAAAPTPVHLSLNGKVGDFRSVVVSGTMPVMLVDGHAMVPYRMFDEAGVGPGIDSHLEGWGIYFIGDWPDSDNFAFKVGDRTAYRRVPMIGGDAAEAFPMPIAPRFINGRLYLSAVVITYFGHSISWDNASRTLVVVTKTSGKNTK